MSELPTTAEERAERLSAMLSGTRAQTRAGRRMQMNRPGNLLFGVLLHAAARLDRGLPLTDLEQRLVDTAGKYLPAGELPGLGRVYGEACARGPIAVLPRVITDLPLEKGFGSADLTAALPALAEEITAQPNVRIVDVSRLAEGESIDTDEDIAAMADYGRGITILTAPPQDASLTGPITVRVRMHKFHVVEESAGEVGADEIYWGLGAGSDTTAKKSFDTREYGSIHTGEVHHFDYVYGKETYLFNGTVDKHMSAEIQCWEADNSPDSFYQKLRDALADFADHAADTSSEISQAYDNEARKAAAWAALLSLGAGLLNALLGLFVNDDDLVHERSFGWTRDYLISMSRMPNGENYFHFNGGDGGYHKLYLRLNDLG
ncbi:hypothetical protein ABZW30_46280 [Kitasatospora sp. NPDC004669]|uniref:hypothetical protein n=1 Tax=Kitasatospora sp. NPDC004669 TaxID=3154555 RepID=UPI0033B266EB